MDTYIIIFNDGERQEIECKDMKYLINQNVIHLIGQNDETIGFVNMNNISYVGPELMPRNQYLMNDFIEWLKSINKNRQS